jgi:hypothetical protein
MTHERLDSRNDIRSALVDRLARLAKSMAEISEGGGKPGELVDQIVKVAESLIAYDGAFGMRPEEELIRHALAGVKPDPDAT